jgi:hypothetical protein
LFPCLAWFRSATLLRWSSSDLMYCSSSSKSSPMLWGSFLVKCELVGPGVRPLINAWIVVLSTVLGICDFCYMNLLMKLWSGSLSLCLQLKRSDGFAEVSWNTWNAWMNFVLRSIQLQIECRGSKEYQLRIGPSQVMMKDLANATSSPPAKFIAAS